MAVNNYQVTVKAELMYDITVEADSFQEAIDVATEISGTKLREIMDVSSHLVEDEIFVDATSSVAGVYKL